MKMIRPIRPVACIVGALISLVFLGPIGQLEATRTLAELASVLVLGVVGVPILLTLAVGWHFVLPSLFPGTWHVPERRISPLLIWSEPLNFFHFGATLFMAAGITGVLVALVFRTVPMELPLEFFLVGLGSWLGVKLSALLYPSRTRRSA